MRRATNAVAATALLCAGCGNYSTEDLEFLVALPQKDDLTVAVPAPSASGAAVVCPVRSADTWAWAKPTSDSLNAAVGWIVGLVDVVRRYPPTWRDADQRGWGPFDAEEHPGREIQVLIDRSYPPALGGRPQFHYQFQARWKGAPDFTTIIEGWFDGASASRGSGDVTLFFQSFWDLGMNQPDTPHGDMHIVYDRASDPVTIALDFTQDGFGVVLFRYEYTGYAGGRGNFNYRFRNLTGDEAVVRASYDAAGAGRAAVSFTPNLSPVSYGYDECWDANACLVYVNDPFGMCLATPPPTACSFGSVSACPTVPVPPF